jgi:UDP-4-amino-4-deoxy-L-arabinose-oxoglutarate aminotransferase
MPLTWPVPRIEPRPGCEKERPTLVEIREEFLPIAVPDITDREIDEVVNAMRSGWISTGPRVERFESLMADRHAARHAIAVSSCTAALFLVAKNLGIGPGDEVIVPSITWPSTANIVEQLGATPVFVDVDRRTANVTPEILGRALEARGSRVKAVIPVHMSGLPVDIEGIEAVAEKHGVALIFDAAHAVFSEYRGRPVGCFGRASCFSFYAIKNLTCGDGGVITCDDDDLADSIRLWACHGMNHDAWKRYQVEEGSPHVQCVVPGYKFNLTDLHAALGIAQLERADELLERRNTLVEKYNHLLAGMADVETPVYETEQGRWGNHVYGIRLLDENQDRDRVMELLRRRYKVGTNVHFLPTHQHRYYRKRYPGVRLPNAEWLGGRVISLPLCTRYDDEDCRYVVDCLRDVLDSGLAVVR